MTVTVTVTMMPKTAKDPSRTLFLPFATQFLGTSHLREQREHTINRLLSIAVHWRKLRTMTEAFKLAAGPFTFQVELPNGRNVEICSKEGADEFVDNVGSSFISTVLTATEDQEDHELTPVYALILAVAKNASPDKIASGIPESELRTFIEHMRDTLDTTSFDRNWLRSGTLNEHHELLLRAVACFSMHSSFLKIFLANEGMEAVAKLYASRKKNDTPDRIVAQSILLLVSNALMGLSENGAQLERGFNAIEKSGLLGQFIRCVPVDPDFSAGLLTLLQPCLQLIKKKLKSGTPTGEILDAVIAEKDGPINEKAGSSLARLQSAARLSNNNYDNRKSVGIKICHHCQKIETQVVLMKCQRCKSAYYCGKECQVADWKIHKRTCNVDVG
jgi:hypothetical protein